MFDWYTIEKNHLLIQIENSTLIWFHVDDVVVECFLFQIHWCNQFEERNTREKRRERFAYSLVAKSVWMTWYRFEPRANRWLFFRSVSLFSIDFFSRIFFACDQRYPVEISTGTGVIDDADSEYEIFFHREIFVKNSSGVIWAVFS